MSSACATHKLQYEEGLTDINDHQQPTHSFYIVGGYGNQNEKNVFKVENLLKERLRAADENSTLVFVGDNISDRNNAWEKDRSLIDSQLQLSEDFKGDIIFLPGNNEWKSKHIDSIQKVEEYLNGVKSQDDYVLPKNGCPLEFKVINDSLNVLLVDSSWFLSNWSQIKGINKKCTDIVTRRRFAEELEGYINDSQGKNLVIAMHHPIFSNGKFAGHSSFKDHMTPFPLIGSALIGVEELATFSSNNLLSRPYNFLRILVSSLAKASDRITVISGHEESLQYLSGGSIHQIISGSFKRSTPTKRTIDNLTAIGGSLPFKGHFTYGKEGFAQLDYYGDGSSKVTFVTADETPKSMKVLPKFKKQNQKETYAKLTAKSIIEPVYAPDQIVQRSKFYKLLWGNRYRKYFQKGVTARVTYLDTLYGGLEYMKKGGGHQSHSLRLQDKGGREYAMRSLRKDPLKYLRFSIKGVAYIEDEYKGTLPENLISDFFTTAHPYMQLVINPMARSADVNHANAKLFYIPKQESLGELNNDFGNELYFIEQRPSDEQFNYKGYRRTIDEEGKITDFESTTDMLEKIKGDESYSVDQQSYVRARVFDMLLGDWDRHEDQWRWVQYETPDGHKEFMPVPRDRDNAFPKFDGMALDVVQWFIPITRQWQSYGPTIEHTKWLNYNGSRLDKVILTNYDAAGWEKEARYVQENLSKEVIDEAFLRLPTEVQDSTSDYIKESLKKRLIDLPKYAKEYGEYLDRIVVLYATEKDDEIKIVRLPEGQTKVVMRRLLSDEKNEKFYERTFHSHQTKELWIYGLGDNDNFIVSGEGKNEIFVRVIGGYGKDDFDIKNRKALKVYDWKHEEIEFKGERPSKELTNIYETNTFHWRYFKPDHNILIPEFDYRTDDGFSIGARDTYTHNGFNGNPFRQKHTLSAKYFFDFQAMEVSYKGIFANILPKWNFELDGYFSSQRYARNFFGLGNDSRNEEDRLGKDFYRARTEQIKLSAGMAYQTLRLKLLYESNEIEEMPNRFFTSTNIDPMVFEKQEYVGGEASLYYYNDDADDFPTKGIYLGFAAGYKSNMTVKENHFGYVALKTEVVHKLVPSGKLVLGTKMEYKTNLGNGYNFYHAPSIGGDNGLRGFRDERFTGKSYLYHSSDLRIRLKRYVTALAPLTVGIYGGFDYGRVWQPNEESNTWHTSQGLGVWASTGNYLALNMGYFNSVEGNFLQFGFGFGF